MNKITFKRTLLVVIIIFMFKDSLVLNLLPTKNVKGIIINEKNGYMHSHMTNRFTYSYAIIINGKTYTNPSNNDKYSIGDSIWIEYNEYFPSINRAKENDK